MSGKLALGDFTGLGKNYAQNRPDYSSTLLHASLGILQKAPKDLVVADIGAGTGIWTEMVSQIGVQKIYAVEPNDDMRSNANLNSKHIEWIKGSAEHTGLADSSVDWVTMASSFHWADFDLAVKEFNRILKPDGWFTALWNPRLIEVNPLLVEIENHIKAMMPNLERVSSGRSGITNVLTEKLENCEFFEDVTYLEAKHVIKMSPERYIGTWRSVNDLQVKMGEVKFEEFITFLKEKTKDLKEIDSTY
jgi:ubiquinone/menaquinone biosynthesis C-methylase UbiE